jgi:glycosyltransferase involved in cell wall biosynthesis
MLTESPLVSVVMPVKACHPSFLEKSVESVLSQTLTNLELIVVLDCGGQSVDKPVLDVLENFVNDKRLRIVFNKEKGFVEALNFGILVSRGEYIARMDGDDISLPTRLERQVEAIEQLHLDLVGGWAYVIDEDGSTIGKLTPPTDAFSIRKTIMLHNPFLHSAMLFKKSILQYSGLYNKALYGAEDYDLWLRIVSLGYAYANLPDYVILLRETSNSVMRGKQWKTTRANYARAKALGLTRLGYHDPLSVSFCFVGPFSLLIRPKMASDLKILFRFFKKTSVNV